MPVEGSGLRVCSQFKNNYFTEMRSGSEEGSCLRLIDGSLGWRVIMKKKVPTHEVLLREARLCLRGRGV